MIMDSTSGAAITVVAGLIYRDGRLLVCQRRGDGPFPLKWEFPGGKVEKGESDIDALRRELREELAVEACGAVFVCQYDHSYPAGPTVSLRFYHVSEFTGAVKNLIFKQISWRKLADLAQLDFLEGDLPIIQKLLLDGEATLIRR